jgi:hypothetical protein
MAVRKPAIGDRFRNLDVTWQSEWVVEVIRVGTDSHEYAQLRSVSDQTLRKTLSLSALLEPARFVLVANASATSDAYGPAPSASI